MPARGGGGLFFDWSAIDRDAFAFDGVLESGATGPPSRIVQAASGFDPFSVRRSHVRPGPLSGGDARRRAFEGVGAQQARSGAGGREFIAVARVVEIGEVAWPCALERGQPLDAARRELRVEFGVRQRGDVADRRRARQGEEEGLAHAVRRLDQPACERTRSNAGELIGSISAERALRERSPSTRPTPPDAAVSPYSAASA